ncbi:tRNA-dihydrouridine(20a/20b) synthase [NAD(P)+]-like [Daphnia magna]|uniref:tRNA-dihydrouridine synthase n=2 Tax=Daphnia magna TaxID=35525 RepID=A0ABQ9ZRY0_9CRUS|nr:tRNA-dihydrouridine(20a/20b) synthase [NAD(P)+]-like [Daphnia magna]KAK4015688.1 hypothetical protein OUZ56_030662 [Daphnia magna]
MVLELFEDNNLVKICAPMVRYSKLPFRLLVRKYGCDLAFTPMIISDSFIQAPKARDIEFTTCDADQPLIVQFAAHNATDFATASELVAKNCNGVDLNCGCPQKWAMQQGYGACLINKPELLRDVVLQTRNRIPSNDFTVSIKIRIHSDIRKTVELCQQVEAAGLSFLTVHGRTKDQKSDPVNLEAVKLIKQSVRVPVIANGDICSIRDAENVQRETCVNGVMAARGILENPAMFAGFSETPIECIKDWIKLALETGVSFTHFHHHLIYMCEKNMSRVDRRYFNALSSTTAVIDYMENYLSLCE